MDFVSYIDTVIRRRDVSTRDKVIFFVIAECEQDLNDDPEFSNGLQFTNSEIAFFTGLSEDQARRGLASLVRQDLLRKIFRQDGTRLISVKELYNENVLVNLLKDE